MTIYVNMGVILILKHVLNFLLFFLFVFSQKSFAGEYLLLPIDSVYDGDTIKTHFHTLRLPDQLRFVSVRVRGIDTPEMPAKSFYTTRKLGRAKCEKEAELAIKARNLIIDLIVKNKATTMKVTNFKWGKYGGRIVGDIKIAGEDIGMLMIGEGVASPYNGIKQDWCK